MGATNAKIVDLRAFGLRSIESPSLTATAPYVNRVLRFLAQFPTLSGPRKKPAGRHPTGFVARPPSQRGAVGLPISVPLGADGGKVPSRVDLHFV
jgi:hypothetical protein